MKSPDGRGLTQRSEASQTGAASVRSRGVTGRTRLLAALTIALLAALLAVASPARAAEDSTPPQILSFSITPSEVNTEFADQTLTVTMTLTDDMTGVASDGDSPLINGVSYSSSQMNMVPLIGTQQVIGGLSRVSGTDMNGVYTTTITLARGSKEGVWHVGDLYLRDKIGNSVSLDADGLNSLLLTAEGLIIANTATAQQVTIERDWTISTERSSVTFPAGTAVTRADDGRFAFYQMAAQEFTLDDSIPTTDLDGVPIATLQFGIPGLNLTFDKPVTVSMAVGSAYNGYRLNIQSLTEGGTAWANETACDVVDGRVQFTVNHATRFAASVAKATVTSFLPALGPVGTTVTLTGTNFTGATKVTFHGASAVFSVNSATKITATVPSGATTGTIAVTTPGGSGTSATSFTVVVTPKVTLRLRGLTSGHMRLGRRVTAKGRVTPASLVGSKVKLQVQKKKARKWVTLKTVRRTISASGAYSWKYKPAKRGAYRMRATVVKSAAHAAAKSPWRKFNVK